MTADGEVTGYTYNEAEQLVAAGDKQDAYDVNGNLIYVSGPDETAAYRYDTADRLSEAYFDDETWIGYLYDGFGRKIYREEEY